MIVFKWLKQPVILGYIVAGFFTGPSISFLPTVSDTSGIKIWADIGVIFLLFAMGLEFSFRKLLNCGTECDDCHHHHCVRHDDRRILCR